MSEKSREERLLEYEKEYLERLETEGKLKPEQKEISEEVRREMTVDEAEKVQADAASQVQATSAAEKDKKEFDAEVSKIRAELKLLKEMATLNDELESLKQDLRKSSKKKTTKKKSTPKRKTAKKKVTKKKSTPKRKTAKK